MHRRKWLAIAVVAGVLGTTAAVAAVSAADGGLLRKVTGAVRGDVSVAVNGEETGLKPVYIDGRAYLPARELAAFLRYDLYYNSAEKRIELTDEGNVSGDEPSPAEVSKFRELGWGRVSEEEKRHLITKKEEAAVEVDEAKVVGRLAADEEGQKLLAELQENGGQLVKVTYRTDRDELIGPLVAVFDRESGRFVGYFFRK